MNLHEIYLAAQLAKKYMDDNLSVDEGIPNIVTLDSMEDYEALTTKTADFYFIKEEEE